METSQTIVLPNNWEESSSKGITIATFNTLRRRYEFSEKYWVPEEARNWTNRQVLHQELLPSLHADIICVQEAEILTFDEDFGFLTNFGYTAIKPVVKDAKEAEEHGHTKPSIFFKTAKFNLKWHNPRSRIVIVNFEDIETGHSFYVINCHLQGGRESDQRLYQMRSALQQLQIHSKKSKIADNSLSCFICGDFNARDEEPVHYLLKKWKSEN